MESLLGESFELTATTRNTPWRAETGDELWQEMSESFGPIKTLLGALPPERAASFERELRDFFSGEQVEGEVVLDRPYLLVVGVRGG